MQTRTQKRGRNRVFPFKPMKISFKRQTRKTRELRETKLIFNFTCEPLGLAKQPLCWIWNAFTGMLKYIFPWLPL